jgi:hypothetical protein
MTEIDSVSIVVRVRISLATSGAPLKRVNRESTLRDLLLKINRSNSSPELNSQVFP